jgi:hypothetical protein
VVGGWLAGLAGAETGPGDAILILAGRIVGGEIGSWIEDKIAAAQISPDGITRIEEHLARPELDGDNPPNQEMIARLRAGETSTQDINFYQHELHEADLMDQGMEARAAHLQTLGWQGIPYEPGYERQLYAPNVIQKYPEYFSPANHQ